MNTKPLSIIIVIFVVLLLFVPGKTLAATQTQSVTLSPNKGQEIGFVYEAFLNPNQEPAEEEDTPPFAPKEFLSTEEPSVPRNQRKSRGHGMLRITNDLSKAYVYVKTENVNFEDINMFHIHCGRPDQLGPILIDFANYSNLQENFADGTFEVELRNEDIEKVSNSGQGIVGAFTAGCPIVPGIPDNVKTIAGMQYIAQKGELYFNLHTKAQTFYGDIRGKLHPVMY
ncbi:MAG: CHRD domain-containing protein [Okeania sp. SIO3C4]|nr:CHRD domain-containing protein [Okeania sp. SIO3C4]